ncbi:MAG: hypothetical protein ACE5HP_02885 [Gemmatimonadota bacterium]
MNSEPISRRDAVARLGALGAVLVAGCTPLRVVLKGYPERFETDAHLVERTLRAFVVTVVPAVSEDDRGLVRAFYDEDLSPLAKYRGFLAADLAARAFRRFGHSRFDDLETPQRTRVILDGLRGDGTTRRLYEGAIFLTQVAVYAGIYDDERGCPEIEWEGRYRPRPWSEITYPEPESFLGRSLTSDGNYG